MKPTLVVLAAGMGSRYGGVKQISAVGLHDECLLDYAAYDAKASGFGKVVYIIRKDIEKDFREIAGKRIEKLIDTEYVFQDISSIPSRFDIPKDRTKPYGTVHAVLSAKDKVDSPFVTINADDYYGPNTLRIINDYITKNNAMCMAGFKLGNTITENGKVSRGICEVEDGFLKSIKECKEIDKNSGIPLDSVASMNMWGFKKDVFGLMEESFYHFLENIKDPMKGEYILTDIVNKILDNKNDKIKVLDTPDKWYGVTYKEDLELVRQSLTDLIEKGFYKW